MLSSTIISAFISFVMLASPATAVAVPDPVAAVKERQTGIDIQSGCTYFYGAGYNAVAAGPGYNDWECINGGSEEGLDFNAWCNVLCPNTGVFASCSGDVLNWVCET